MVEIESKVAIDVDVLGDVIQTGIETLIAEEGGSFQEAIEAGKCKPSAMPSMSSSIPSNAPTTKNARFEFVFDTVYKPQCIEETLAELMKNEVRSILNCSTPTFCDRNISSAIVTTRINQIGENT